MLRAALRFVDGAQAIEDRHDPAHDKPHHDPEHSGYVLSAVINSAVFLEAAVNELFADAYENHGVTDDGYIAPLDEKTRHRIAAWWGEHGDRSPILSKYQMLLALADQPRLDRDAAPFQDAAALVKLRNRLVHYEPETLFAVKEHAVEKQLGGKFADNTLMVGSGNSWWPSHALGAGCAQWACTSAVALADEVVDRLGVNPNYRRQLFSK